MAQVNTRNTSAMQVIFFSVTLFLAFVSTSPVKKNFQFIPPVQSPISASGPHLISFSRIATFSPPKLAVAPATVSSTPPQPVTTLPPPDAPSAENCGNIYIARDGKINPTTSVPKAACPTTLKIDARYRGASHVGRFNAAVPTQPPLPQIADKQTKNDLQNRVDPPASTSSASPIYIARDDNRRQTKYHLLPPLPVRGIVEARQTAPGNGGAWQGRNGGVIFIAHDDQDSDSTSSFPQSNEQGSTTSVVRKQHVTVPPPGGDITGCVIYIARDSKITTTKRLAPYGGCPDPPPQRQLDSHYVRVEKDVDHEPIFNTLATSGLPTLTVVGSTSTGRETGGVVISGVHSSKTRATIRPSKYAVDRGSGTFTVITSLPTATRYVPFAERIPPPEWLSTHIKSPDPSTITTSNKSTHIHSDNKPATLALPGHGLLA
ncbi:uncharacterized protein RSE6_00884 [Rhynchosporium secalis]|uniref:Uncharacterized protein n=1 Tax=Rhynchosporium secalis TaxID=38038 RepID=A0A1E1LWC8_RHYSE|nr:uncharacterized protein RSE6_00884 [Rhynchosporium secalis]